MNEDENEAIRKASRELKKDPDANFAPFYDLTKRRVYFLAFSYTHDYALAEDLTQETYVSFLENLSKISLQRNPLSYLLSVARNKAIDELRKRHPDYELDKDDNTELVGRNDPSEDEAPSLLKEIEGLLSPFEFQVYTLHVLGGLSFKSISRILKRPVGTLTYTYSASIDKLQKGVNPLWMSNSKNN